MAESRQDSDLNAVQKEPKKGKDKKKKSGAATILRVIISLIIIILGVILILFLVARAAKYENIAEMLNHMFVEMDLMWKRIMA
jgi:flagellar basal body-associated protein FliL